MNTTTDIEDIIWSFNQINVTFLSAIDVLMMRVEEKLNSSVFPNPDFRDYHDQPFWKIISVSDKRVILVISRYGDVAVVFQNKLTSEQKTALSTAQDFSPPDLASNRENTFRMSSNCDIRNMEEKITEFLNTTPD